MVVGKVDSVTRTDSGQAIKVHLDDPSLTGLTDALSIDYPRPICSASPDRSARAGGRCRCVREPPSI